MKYVYPVIFTHEADSISVAVPDLPGCYTFGDNLVNAIEMARDAISMWLCDAEDKNEQVPESSNIEAIEHGPDSFINLIDIDTAVYRRENDTRAVKKTLTIPNWLNSKAEKAGINFSQTLQKALKQQLGLE